MADQNPQNAPRTAAAPPPAAQPQPQRLPVDTSATAPAPDQDAGKRLREADERVREARRKRAEDETKRAEEQNRLPANSAITNPAPTKRMNPSSGAFVEDEVREAVPADHPSVDSNPRDGTSAVQNGQDFNDPRAISPDDPEFAGQGLDLSVYGGRHARR
jgi:hypothetical protein